MSRRVGRLSVLVAALLVVVLAGAGCAPGAEQAVIKIGINAPLTGDIPKVGEGTKFAAEMWLEDIEAAGGLEVGGVTYKVELIIEDNESKAESAVAANTKLITQDQVLAIIGPQASKQAVPAGEAANNLECPMISPWSTNPKTTKDRPWVFRACFLDDFQGPAAAKFVTEEFGFTKAAVLYDVASDYPKGLAEFFKAAWEELHGPGSVVAFESFTTKDRDFSAQLTKLVNLAGEDCYGCFFTTHYAAAGATGATKEFIDRYEAKYGYVPDDVAALTWDSLHLIEQAIKDTGGLTGDIEADRKAVRDALARIKNFQGITGNMTFTEEGDPIKACVVVRISEEGEFEFYKFVEPE
jgi:branched-chain amino acid transport system substrate-binding protein